MVQKRSDGGFSGRAGDEGAAHRWRGLAIAASALLEWLSRWRWRALVDAPRHWL